MLIRCAVGFWGRLLTVSLRRFRLDFYMSTEIYEQRWDEKSTNGTFLVPDQEQLECIALQ